MCSFKDRRFGGTYRLHHQGGENQRAGKVLVTANFKSYNLFSPSGLKVFDLNGKRNILLILEIQNDDEQICKPVYKGNVK
jgi:hypothetical protein